MAGKPRPITYKEDENGCWICDSHKTDRDGYPQCHRYGHSYTVHRWIYMQEHDIDHLPFEVKIRHTCDVPSCINPNHLLSGSQRDNSIDMVNRGRCNHVKGTAHHNNRLTNEDVLNIKTNVDSTLVILSKKYNVSTTTISRIKNNEMWTWLK